MGAQFGSCRYHFVVWYLTLNPLIVYEVVVRSLVYLQNLELSEVLWEMVFENALKMSGIVGIFAVFLVFAFWAGMYKEVQVS